MLCERAQELFSDYIEGNVQSAMRVPFDNHIGECESCSKQLESMRAVWTILDDAPIIAPPPQFRDIVWQKIMSQNSAAETAKPRKATIGFDWRSLFRPPVLAFAGAALVLIVFAPLVIPGNHTVAKMFPWSLVSGASQSTDVQVTSAQIADKDGKPVIALHVKNNLLNTVKIKVTVDGGAGSIREIEAGANTNGDYVVGDAGTSKASDLKVTAEWMQEGKSHSASVPVK